MPQLSTGKPDVTRNAQSRNSTLVVENFSAPIEARSRPALLLILCGIVLIAAIVLFIGLTVYELRDRALANTERELSKIGRASCRERV